MKYSLNLVQRLSTLNILPEKGDFLSLKLIRRLRESLSFDEDELQEYKIKQKGSHISWDIDKANEIKEIEIGAKTLEIIQEALKNRNDAKEMNDKEFELYEIFIENNKEE